MKIFNAFCIHLSYSLKPVDALRLQLYINASSVVNNLGIKSC